MYNQTVSDKLLVKVLLFFKYKKKIVLPIYPIPPKNI